MSVIYGSAALHGLISMGLKLNEEAEAIAAGRKTNAPTTNLTTATLVIRSTWMNRIGS